MLDVTGRSGEVWKRSGPYVAPNTSSSGMAVVGSIGVFTTGQRYALRGMSSGLRNLRDGSPSLLPLGGTLERRAEGSPGRIHVGGLHPVVLRGGSRGARWRGFPGNRVPRPKWQRSDSSAGLLSSRPAQAAPPCDHTPRYTQARSAAVGGRGHARARVVAREDQARHSEREAPSCWQ